jgi:hypothetical protein
MARHLGMSGEELAVCLQDPDKKHEEFSALSDRLRAAYPELLKNVRSVSVSSVKQVERPLYVQLRMDEHWDEVLGE